MEVEFFISASFAGMLGGICCLGALAGVLVPLWLMNCFRPTSSRCLFFCGISSILLFIVYIPAVIFLTCNNQPIFGLFDSEGIPISDGSIIENDCNLKCDCQTDIFYPVCDISTNMTYITPCNAGCSSFNNGTFQNCQCIESGDLFEDRCETDCDTLWPFVTCFVFVFAFLYTPLPLAPSAVMRSVPQRLKSFQMSLQLLLVRIFGSIPGPILMGMFIDQSCVLWQVDQDGNRGSCFVYDNRKMVEAFCYFRKFVLSFSDGNSIFSAINEVYRNDLLFCWIRNLAKA